MDLGIYLEDEHLLAFTDVHLGYEEAMTKTGVLIPKFHFKDLMVRMEKMIKETHPETILINGDLKHEFGSISDEEWRNTLKFLDYLKRHSKKLILMKGNHDTIIEPIAKKAGLSTVKSYLAGNVYFTHGDFIPDEIPKEAKVIVIGHEHPAVSIQEGSRVELVKCFLVGKWKRFNLIVLPSFNLVTEGTDVLKDQILSPLLKQNLRNFNVFVVSDKVYGFGKLKNLN